MQIAKIDHESDAGLHDPIPSVIFGVTEAGDNIEDRFRPLFTLRLSPAHRPTSYRDPAYQHGAVGSCHLAKHTVTESDYVLGEGTKRYLTKEKF